MYTYTHTVSDECVRVLPIHTILRRQAAAGTGQQQKNWDLLPPYSIIRC